MWGIDMNKDELISVLTMITNYSYAYLKSLSREELQDMYEKRS